MNVEIITTGTEILLGEIVDTNAAWLARRLRDLGVNLYYKTTVGDNLERITAVMRQSLARSDVAIVTGGLGPTVDDVTRLAAARATGRELALHEQCWAEIQDLFAQWGRAAGENNRRQAFLPAGALPIRNPVGTAPGFIVETPREGRPSALLICLPGVPREMKHLMQETVEPFLAERVGADRMVIKARTLRTIGIGESNIDALITDLMEGSNPTVGLSAHLGQADVRIAARAPSEAEADRMLDEVAAEVRHRLGRHVYAEGSVEVEEVVVEKLRAAGHRLALLESNTGGDVAQRLQGVAGGKEVVPAARQIASLDELASGAPAELVSVEAAEWAARRLFEAVAGEPGADLALAVCGTMDPKAGPYGTPRGKTFIALATSAGVESRRFDVGGIDELASRWVGNAVLNFLRLWLDGER